MPPTEIEHGARVVVLHTVPDAEVTLTCDDAQLTAWADAAGEVRLDLTGELNRDEVEIEVHAVSEGNDDRSQFRLNRSGQCEGAQVRSRFQDRLTPSPLREQTRRAVDVDPLVADDSAVADLGFPPRPGPDADEHQHAVWRTLASQPYLPVAASMAPLPEHPSTFRSDTLTPHRGLPVVADPNFASSTIWCGYALRGGSGDFYQVDAFWRVPDLTAIAGQDGEAAVWVGLDGWTASGVLQTGTNSVCVDFAGATFASHYAWTEWYPAPSHRLSNIPVSAGDLMYARAWHDGNGPHYFVANADRGFQVFADRGSPFDVFSEPTFSGANAEWIVERPARAGAAVPLAPFDRITMSGATALSGGRTVTALDGHPYSQIAMVDQYLRAFCWAEGYIPSITTKFVRS